MRKIALISMLFIGSLFSATTVLGQGMRDMRINEIMVRNGGGLEDSHGVNSGWIEFFNAGYTTADLSGAFITMDINDPSKTYRVPKSPMAVVPPQCYVVFFANGLFHESFYNTNFTLYDSTQTTGVVSLYDASGKGDPITIMEYVMADQRDDVSIGWLAPNEDGTGDEEWMVLSYSTPGSMNTVIDIEPQHVKVKRSDPIGFGIVISAMSVVLIALFCLYLIFRTIGKFMSRNDSKKADAISASAASSTTSVAVEDGLSGEAIAAIAVAVEQYMSDLHDIESTVLTINKVARAYSPWSSKLYGMRQLPNKISNTRK